VINGKFNGTKANVRQKHLLAVYGHCAAHCCLQQYVLHELPYLLASNNVMQIPDI
jgi:hypothetical protein